VIDTRWLWRGAVVLAIAALVHLAALWALPRLIMARVLAGVQAEADAGSGVMLPPPADHRQRRIVLPSPDLLYALCRYDVGARPLRVRAEPRTGQYWSIALYAANADNYFVLNDGDAAGRAPDLLIVGPDAGPVNAAPTAAAVRSPSARGLVLMRLLAAGGDEATTAAALAAAEVARRTLRCESR
jgi:uncharacterized membrane protein